MAKDFSKKFQKAKLHLENFRQKLIVRVWGLAKRLEAKQVRKEKKKSRKS